MMTPCEEWGGFRMPRGYGRIYIDKLDGKQLNVLAHRLIWMQHHGFTELDILHECDNPPCINVAHLRAGTSQDNSDDMVMRGRQGTNGNENKTHCKQGHEFNEGNTYIYKSGRRLCRTCNKLNSRKYRALRETQSGL